MVDELPDKLCEHLDGPVLSGDDGKIIPLKDLLQAAFLDLPPSLGHWLETSRTYNAEQRAYNALCPLAVLTIWTNEVNLIKVKTDGPGRQIKLFVTAKSNVKRMTGNGSTIGTNLVKFLGRPAQ